MFIVKVVFLLLASTLASQAALSNNFLIWGNEPERILSDQRKTWIDEVVEEKRNELENQGKDSDMIDESLKEYRDELERNAVIATIERNLPETYEEYAESIIQEKDWQGYLEWKDNLKKGRVLIIRESLEPGALSLTFIKSARKGKPIAKANCRLWLIEDLSKENSYIWKQQFEPVEGFIPVDASILKKAEIADELFWTIAEMFKNKKKKELKNIAIKAKREQDDNREFTLSAIEHENNNSPGIRTREWAEDLKSRMYEKNYCNDTVMGTMKIVPESDKESFLLEVEFEGEDKIAPYYIKEQIKKIIVSAPSDLAADNYRSTSYVF